MSVAPVPTCSRRFHAFTLIELLVVIALIALLIAITVPTMARIKERSRRVVCMGTMRSFHIALIAYAASHADALPQGGLSDARNTITMRPAVYNALGGEYLCPNLINPFRGEPANIFDSGTYQDTNDYYLLGYNYLGGLAGTPWALNSPADCEWKSPQKSTDTPRLPVLTELNTWISSGYQITFAPHGQRGPIHSAGDSTNQCFNEVAPDLIGAAGGNLCTLDGAIEWKDIHEMKIHTTATEFQLFTYW